MIDNKTARKEVKLLKALNDVTYQEFSEMIGLSKGTIYTWLNGQFDLGSEKLSAVEELIADLKGE